MYKIKFFVQSSWKKIVTGGQKYDSELFNIISDIKGIDIECEEIGCNKKCNPISKMFIEFKNGIKKQNADLIIFNSSKCLRFLILIIYLRLIKRKNIYSIHHHFIYLEFKGLKRLVYKTAESIFLRLSKKIIIPSPYIYSILSKKRKSEDLLFWRIPFETKAEFMPDPVIGNLSYAGTIEPRKGLIYLIEALKILKERNVDYNLQIMGKVVDENYYKNLKETIEQNNLNVNFTGFLSLEEKNRILSQSDIFVFPSLLEGFGMVLVEAQVYGLPIVCFNNSSMPYSVKNNINGFLIKTGDYKSMADEIQKIINDRKLREKLSKGALENVKDQNTYKNFKETVTHYFNELIKNQT